MLKEYIRDLLDELLPGLGSSFFPSRAQCDDKTEGL